MKGKIEAIILKEFANIFRKLDISDIRVEVRDDGWYTAMVCPENVRLAEVLLTKEAWEEYDFASKTFAIDADKLYKYASDFKKGEIVEIVFEDTAAMEATFYLDGMLTRTFKLLSEEYVTAKPKIPELEYKVRITLLAPQIKLIKDILATKLEGVWGNEIAIGVVERSPEEYELCLYAADDEGIKNKACVPLERGTNYLVIEPCASIYAFDYLKSIFGLITKEVGATGTVTIQFAFEYPLKLSYEHKGIVVKQILLAPRIDEAKKLKEVDVLEELRTPFKPIEKKEAEIATTATTLYFLPTAKGRLLKPFKRKEYTDVELIDILLEKPLPEIEGILSHLKLEAIWKESSYDKYGAIVKEEEISREPADIDALIKIVENYDLIEKPYLEIREYYKHPEELAPVKEPWRRLMDIIKDLEKEYGLEVPLDDVIAIAKEEGIENPEELIHKLKADGILYSPIKGTVARVEREETLEPREVKEAEKTLIGEETMTQVKRVINHWMSTEERRKNTCELELDNFIKVITAHTSYTPDLVSRGIGELKAEGVLFTPREGVIRRTECEEAKPPEEKEPWMMTREEWIREHIKNVDKLDKWIRQAELGETVDISTTEIDENFPVGKVLIYGNIASTFPSTFDETSKTIYINIDKPSDYVSEILNIKDKTIQVYYALLHEVEHLRWAIEGKPLNPYSPETQYEKYYSHPSEVAAREASTAFLKPLLDAHRKAVRQAISEGKQVPKEVLADYPDLIPEEEIPEEKWENVTKEKLEEARRTSKFSKEYAISQAKAAKKVSATEKTVYEKLPDELELGPYSDVLLYAPVDEIRYLPKAEHAAFIKLVDRGWFQVYKVPKPVSDKYPRGFTYVLKKTKEEEKPSEKEILLKKVKEELEYEEISLTESGEEYLKEAVETFYDTGRTDLVREIMSHVSGGDKIADIIIPVFLKEEIEEKIKPFKEKMIKELISEAEAAIDDCDKGFETCLESCDDDLEVCYEECVEAEDVPKCNKECEEKRDKCHDKCEEDALKCYDDSAREIIERDIEEGDLTQAEEDLETFMDYVSDKLYEELANRIKPIRPPPSPDDLELIPEVKIKIEKGQERLM